MEDRSATWDTGVEYASVSDVGLRRSNNQDSYAVVTAQSQANWSQRGHLFMVADGMGAHAAGELASKMAADTVPLTYSKLTDEPPAMAIRQAIEDANSKIHSRGQANFDFRGMGTTTSVLLLLPEGAVVAHVGDSRVYRFRAGQIEQLSFDHSLVWEMMASGKVREDEVPNYIPKNIITRSLGPSVDVQVDLEGPFPLAVGDTFMLCSDGLSGQVTDEEMGVILGTLPPAESAQALVDLANLRGGPDNITVIVAQVRTAPTPSSSASMTAAGPAARARAIHPFAWVLLGVLVLMTPVLALSHWRPAALFTGLAAFVIGAALLVRKLGSGAPNERMAEGPRFGRGPHTSHLCPVNNAIVDKLAKLVEQLREAAVDEQWTVNWLRFNAFCTRALTAAEQKSYEEAVREYCHAISFMMGEIRGQRKKRNGGGSMESDAK